MKKRLAIMLLCIVLIAILCSCNQSNQQSDWEAKQAQLNRSIEETTRKHEQLPKELNEMVRNIANN